MDEMMSATQGWVHDLNMVTKYGNRASPRGMAVIETLAYQSQVDMNNPIIFDLRRKLGYKFMAAEAAWILSGRDDVDSIAPYSKEISKFSDNGETFFGAYGPPLMEQMSYVIRCLQEDRDSRQAVSTIWRQNPEPSKDIPCTVALQWLIRNSELHCVATMRSSDLWLGHPYDIFNFSALSFYIMLQLNYYFANKEKWPVRLGRLFLNAGSKHLYQRNLEEADLVIQEYQLSPAERVRNSPFDATRYDSADEFVTHLWEAAESEDGVLDLVEGG